MKADALTLALRAARKCPLTGARVAISVPDGRFVAVRVRSCTCVKLDGGEWLGVDEVAPTIAWRPL